MGASTVRITEEDFVIPPEFAGQRLASKMASQVGGVRLELIEAAGKTRLGRCYAQIPLFVLSPFHFDREPAALLYLMNPTVGLMEGDGHHIEIVARAGTRTVLTGQSAARIHPAGRSFATQQWHVQVDDGAELVILPGAAIPYRGARFYHRVEVTLAPTARFIWGDVWLPGRYLREDDPEVCVFDHLVQDLQICRGGQLIYRDRFAWHGPWTDEQRSWHLGRHLASGSLFVTGPVGPLAPPPSTDVECVVLPLAQGDTCIRCCGQPPAVTWECARLALALAGGWTGGVPWLLTGNNFAPNHWFSRPPG